MGQTNGSAWADVQAVLLELCQNCENSVGGPVLDIHHAVLCNRVYQD